MLPRSMKFSPRTLLLALPVLLVSSLSCREIAMPPAGSYSEVLLVTETGSESEWTTAVSPYIARQETYVTSTESAFRISVIRASQLEDFPTFKNIVLCGVLDTSTKIGTRIAELIGEVGARQVFAGKASILKKENLPSPGQMTLIITSATPEGLAKVINERGYEIADVIEESCRERLRHHLLARADERLSQELHRKYGFALAIPTLYHLQSEKSDPPGIELIREPPTRSLGIFWADWKEPISAENPDPLFDLRAKYVWERYDHDKMERDRVSFEPAKLGPYDAVRMKGYWYNDKATVGGYFETYFIFDEDVDLLWAVDLLVYAPGKAKHPLVRELRALAETFRYD